MSNRRFSTDEWNERHLKRVEKYARRIDLIYYSAIVEASQIAVSLATEPEKPFAFEDYTQTAERVESLFRRMALEMIFTIESGQEDAWLFSEDKNDALVDTVFASAVQPDPLSINPDQNNPPAQYKARNLEALEAFKQRKIEGFTLSDRVWRYTGQFRKELELAIDLGLSEGKSANQMSRDIRGYLNEPEQLFRRVRNKRGNLVASKAAKAYHPGQGVYRSSYKNAMRTTRTEINAAYREADHNRYKQLDFVVGFEVRRSNNPGHCDTCAKLKGRYPKTFKFTGWHPQCRCHVVSILATPDELRELNEKILNGEPTKGFRSVNEVTDLPDGFKQWLADNEDRINRAKAKPQFLQDNYKGKKPTFTLPAPLPKTVQGIDLSRFIKGTAPTNAEMKSIIMEFARAYPDNFDSGLESVSILKSKSYLMQHSRLFNPSTKQWSSQSSISLSTHDFSIGGKIFNPTEELRGAFAAMKANTPLTFNQEYSVEALWHEILHGKSKRPPVRLNSAQTQNMETINQFVARHTYPDFLKAFNTNPLHQKEILDNGYGYKGWVSAFRQRLKNAGISEEQAVKDFMPVLMSDYVAITKKMLNYFK